MAIVYTTAGLPADTSAGESAEADSEQSEYDSDTERAVKTSLQKYFDALCGGSMIIPALGGDWRLSWKLPADFDVDVTEYVIENYTAYCVVQHTTIPDLSVTYAPDDDGSFKFALDPEASLPAPLTAHEVPLVRRRYTGNGALITPDGIMVGLIEREGPWDQLHIKLPVPVLQALIHQLHAFEVALQSIRLKVK